MSVSVSMSPSSSPFTKYENTIQSGDLVIAYTNPDQMTAITMKPGDVLHNKYGSYAHDNIIGKPWGCKVESSHPKQKGYMFMLHPTPELWTISLPHRTQILYMPDIALVSQMLDLVPGSVVIESGTGSGSFSHSIARTISPSGKLHTFEYHEERSRVARKEFEDHGLGNIIQVHYQDVCKDGFGMENIADAVFLDLPSPWDAIESAKKAFKRNKVGRLCTFSPCIEQIQRTCTALKEHGFFDVRMFETLIRPHEVKTVQSKSLPQRKVHPSQQLLRKRKVDDVESSDNHTATVDEDAQCLSAERSIEGTKGVDTAASSEHKVSDEPSQIIVSRTKSTVRGHTSFLVFASILPKSAEKDSKPE